MITAIDGSGVGDDGSVLLRQGERVDLDWLFETVRLDPLIYACDSLPVLGCYSSLMGPEALIESVKPPIRAATRQMGYLH